jgi:hypothetical protein
MIGLNFRLYKVDKNRCVLLECPIHMELELEEKEGTKVKTGRCVSKRCGLRVVGERNMKGSESCRLDGDEEICYLNYDGTTVCVYLLLFFF